MSSSKSGKVIKPKAKSLGKGKPKRATGPFGFFIANSLKTMKTFDKTGEAMKKASESWKQMSDADKAPYTTLAKKDLDRYHREMNAVNATKLKRPPSSYLLFVKAFMHRESGNYPSPRDAVSAASREWKEMSDNQKAPFARDAAALSAKYKADKAKHDAEAGAGTSKSPRKKVAASKVKVASLGGLKSRTRAATAKKPASKAKKTTVKSRAASKARKPAVQGASKARKAAPARSASKPRAASKARKPASKARKAAPARSASKPRTVSKARKTVGKAKKAGGRK
jgi:hypothetical protein